MKMSKKFGDQYKSLPINASQELPPFELEFMEGLRKRKQPPVLKDTGVDSDSEADSDAESDSEEDLELYKNTNTERTVMTDVKITLIASGLFFLFANDIVSSLISKAGLDGIKLLFIKVVLFAICFFIIHYKFL